MRKNEFSCYFLNSAGQHIFHFFVYVCLKLVLLFLLYGVCRNRSKAATKLDYQEEQRQRQQREKELQRKLAGIKHKASPEPKQKKVKYSCISKAVILLFKLNRKFNVSAFFTILELFSIEFLISGFANFRFLKTNSFFGIISFVTAELVIVGMLIVLAVCANKIRLMKKLQKELRELIPGTKNVSAGSKEGKEEAAKLLQKALKNRVEQSRSLRNWYFLIEDLNPELQGFWIYFPIFNMAKEILVVLFVILFIGKTLV